MGSHGGGPWDPRVGPWGPIGPWGPMGPWGPGPLGTLGPWGPGPLGTLGLGDPWALGARALGPVYGDETWVLNSCKATKEKVPYTLSNFKRFLKVPEDSKRQPFIGIFS